MPELQHTSKLVLESTLESLKEVNPWLERTWNNYNIPGDRYFDISLCLYEAVANIIMYAFEQPLGHQIHVTLEVRGNVIDIIIEDDGRHFNPLEHPEAIPSTTVSDATIGGHGITLIRRLSDKLHYEWCAPGNRLIITNHLI